MNPGEWVDILNVWNTFDVIWLQISTNPGCLFWWMVGQLHLVGLFRFLITDSVVSISHPTSNGYQWFWFITFIYFYRDSQLPPARIWCPLKGEGTLGGNSWKTAPELVCWGFLESCNPFPINAVGYIKTLVLYWDWIHSLLRSILGGPQMIRCRGRNAWVALAFAVQRPRADWIGWNLDWQILQCHRALGLPGFRRITPRKKGVGSGFFARTL